MSSAEFDTRRRLLGLSMAETAEVCRGVSEKSVNRWINDDNPTPDWALEELDALETIMRRQVAAVMEHYGRERSMPLNRYRNRAAYEASPDKPGLPFGAHCMMVGWAAQALEEKGCQVELIWAGGAD